MKSRARVVGFLVCVMAFLLAGPAEGQAPDVTGNWTGKFIATKDGRPAEESGYAMLKQTGTTITGSVGPRADRQQAINTGVIETVKGVTIVKFDSGRPGHVLRFELTLADGKLTGMIKDETYPDTKITAELQREK